MLFESINALLVLNNFGNMSFIRRHFMKPFSVGYGTYLVHTFNSIN